MPALALLLIALAPPAPELRPVARLQAPGLRECSGAVVSRNHPGVVWVHNGSGNPPRLFAIRPDGSTLREYAPNVPNLDWEDIAADDHGRLYVGDIGNNDARLPLRVIHVLDEPDPAAKSDAAGPTPLRVRTACYYRFGPGGRFDAEGLAVRPDGRTALIVAKTFDGRDAEVYELPMEPPAPLLRPAVPRKVGTLPGFRSPVTGADLDRNGRLAVVSGDAAAVYEPDGRGWRRVGGLTYRGGDSIEAIAWDGADLILIGEDRRIVRVAERDWRGAR